MILNCRGKRLALNEHTHIMGILNVTPDSFSDGGKYYKTEHAIQQGIQLEKDGADIIDIGAESTRPGSEPVSAEQELDRLLPVIEALLDSVQVPISVDTYKAAVAERVLEMGAHIINDISGLQFDPEMKNVVAHYDVPVVIMHIKGTPKNMQFDPHYDNLMEEIFQYFSNCISVAKDAGIKRENIIIDPGIGFGKRLQDNFQIIRKLSELRSFACPILVGPSRKSFIGKTLNLGPDQRLEGTAAAVALSIQNGADIVRVHDVKEISQVCKIADTIVGKLPVEIKN